MIPRERTARKWTIVYGSSLPVRSDSRADGSRRPYQPQSEAVIPGHGWVLPKRRTNLAFSGYPALQTAVPSTGTLGAQTGHGAERTWPNHAGIQRQDLARAISEGLCEPDGRARRAAARGGHAEGRADAGRSERIGGVLGAGNSLGGSRAGLRVVRCLGRAGGGGAAGSQDASGCHSPMLACARGTSF